MNLTRLLAITSLFTSGCTFMTQHEAGQDPHGSVLPATVLCLLAACDNTFADRAERAAGSGTEVHNEGAETVDQTATAVPTVEIPLTGHGSAEIAEGVNKLLHSTPTE